MPRYERIAFEKALVAPQGQPPAAHVFPGHPPLDATIDLTLERHRDLSDVGQPFATSAIRAPPPRVLFLPGTLDSRRSVDASW